MNGGSEAGEEMVERLSGQIVPSLKPVRPLPLNWVSASVLAAISAGIGIPGGLRMGLLGLRKLSVLQIASIFPLLGALVYLTATTTASEMTPGSKRRLTPLVLLATVTVALLLVFGLLFRDYRMGRFVPEGIRCLEAGLLLAMPAGVAAALLLRRGFVLSPARAGISVGVLSGLAGLAALELHCENFLAMHVMVWHVAVVLLSSLSGWMIGRLSHRV